MLTKKQIKEIKAHLEKAQNPVFFFDNDPDGLCAFLLLQRYIGRGKGVSVTSFPDLSLDYFRKIKELNADYIFILDKPVVSKEFFEAVKQINIPVVWIDHHEIDKKNIPEFVNYYNPLLNKSKTNEPVTYLCYKITQKKEDLWIAVIGSISDKFVPDFYSEFLKEYPDLGFKTDEAFDIFYKSQIGEIAMIFSFALKDRTTNVVNMLKFLMKVKTPYEVLEENTKNKTMHDRFNQVKKKYKKLMEKAELLGRKPEKILFFQYASDLSISAELSNRLSYYLPDKYIVVMRISGDKVSISCRGKNIRKYLLEVIKDLDDATGGGHEDAVGAKIKVEDLEKFKKNLGNLIEKGYT